MGQFILWIDGNVPEGEVTPTIGGKGAGLVSLTKLGIPVPPAFAVTADAYTAFLRENDLEQRIHDALDRSKDRSDMEALRKASDELRRDIVDARIPESIRREIATAYASLRERRGTNLLVAVRSSATAEDLPTASFAGQQETFLNVQGEEAVLDGVKHCWASVWTARSMAYREKSGFADAAVRGCVIVQEMFPSESSGVLFTVNPISGDMSEIVVNSSWGLGEAIVSGLVNPDEYVLDKATLEIKRKQVTDKRVKVVRASDRGGTRQEDVEERDRRRESLGESELRTIAELAKRIEEAQGWPQDIEWGVAGGQVSVLQARPVTGVEIDFNDELELSDRGELRDDDQIVWSRKWSDHFRTGPCSPLMYSIDVDLMTQCYSRMHRLFGLRRFDELRLLRWYKARPYFSCRYERERVQLLPKFARSEEVIDFFPPSRRDEIRRLPFKWWLRLWGYVHLFAVAPQYRLDRCIDTFYRELPEWLGVARDVMQNLDLEKAPLEKLLPAFERTYGWETLRALDTTSVSLLEHLTFLILVLNGMLRHWCGDEHGLKYAALASGLARSKTTEENAAVWKLSRLVRDDTQLAALFERSDSGDILHEVSTDDRYRSFRESLERFLGEYGHRGASERDMIYPRWRHNPRFLISQIKTLVGADESLDPTRTENPLRERREKTERECFESIRRQRWGWIKLRLFRFVLRWAQTYIPYRDDVRFYGDHNSAIVHDLFRAIGDRLAGRKILASPEDVFFLAYREVVEAAKGSLSARVAQMRVDARRRVYERFRSTTPPMYLRGAEAFDSDVVEEAMEAGTLRGFAASAGRISGRARVCKTLEETEKVQRGDVLVACATDPGWTPVFSILGGVVVETGGILSHSTLVSREYGIPCVTNVNRATELIGDGMLVTVDGNLGRVFLHQEPDSVSVETGTASSAT